MVVGLPSQHLESLNKKTLVLEAILGYTYETLSQTNYGIIAKLKEKGKYSETILRA